MEEFRPDPDQLLASIKKEDHRVSSGKLRIFIGMSAGVGKTYSMLSAAHQKMKEGVDVVIGIVETHGRQETINMTKGLPCIPQKKLEHRETLLEEMDLEAIISRHPHIVLVDELAHTNVPGSRHPKRWQDVAEILDAGIDVFSTINIQHIESRKDDVEGITDITIHETVPDSILERADQIEVIDIPPADLLQRLREGKVYLGDKAEQAAQNFFKEDKLTALRQILLRFSAEKVDNELQNLSSQASKTKIWKTQERILLAVGHGPYSEKLVRVTKQSSSTLRCPWFAVYVDTGKKLRVDDDKTLTRNLDLARELGARVITISDTDIANGIDRVCKQYNISQIVIGKPERRPIHNFLNGGSFLEKLNRLNNNVSIQLVRLGHKEPRKNLFKNLLIESNLSQYIYATLYVLGLGFANKFFLHYTDILPYRSIGMVFLLGVTCAGLIFPVGPTIWASLLTVEIWNFFFIPPLYTFTIGSHDDIAMAISFFVVSLITGILTSTIRKNQNLIREQEERTRALYRFSEMMVESSSKEECIELVENSLSQLFTVQASINLKSENGVLEFYKRGEDWIFNKTREWGAALWAFDKGKTSGKWTDTLPDSDCFFVPLIARQDIIGILGIYPKKEALLTVNDREIILTIASQLAMYLQRELFHELAIQTENLRQSEKLHQTLLNSVSHEIKTPLTAITGITDTIGKVDIHDQHTLEQMKDDLTEAVDRLKNIVDNILDVSRFDSGMLALKLDWFSIEDLIDNVLDSLHKQLKDFKIEKSIPEEFPFVFIDGRLFEQAIFNLVLNSIKYYSEQKKIEIKLTLNQNSWSLFYSDSGPGVDRQYHKNLFDKFFRVPGTKAGGSGLGLSIVKSIVELHKGHIHVLAKNTGLAFELVFPLHEQPILKEEYL